MGRAVVLLVCFLSGFSALVCEVVWTRMLVPVFGNTMHATSMVTGVFMGGLALGGALGGRRTAGLSPRELLLAYALLEAGIGLFAFLFPFFKQGLAPVYLNLSGSSGVHVHWTTLMRLVCFSLLLLPPTVLMGATFPVLGVIFIGQGRQSGPGSAWVYGINTLGGTLGVLAAGFFMVPELGSRASLVVAGWISICIALAVMLAAGRGAVRGFREKLRVSIFSRRVALCTPIDGQLAGIDRWVLAGAGLAGFCALAYEMVWTRLLVLVMQNSVYAFALILAGFLAGIGAGSLLAAPMLRRKWPPLPYFAGAQVLCGIACLAAILGFTLPERPGELSYLAFLLTRPFFVVLIPMLLSGSLVPLAVAAVHRPERAVGQTLGRVYAVNAMGSVAGALLAGFTLIPLLGCRHTSLVLFSLQVLFGTLLLISHSRNRRFRLAVAAAGFAVTLLGITLVPADLVQRRYVAAAAGERPIYFREGRVATTSVTRNRTGHRTLYLNGIHEVINDRPALRTFRLMALLPYLMQPDPGDALMITFGAGISAGLAVHLYPGVTSVELNENCRQVARIFARDNYHVLEADNLTLNIDDGRNYLLHSRERYGTIISDATHPHSYDSWILFTCEFYRLCADRLDDSGVFCQWLPLHGLAPRQFRTILNTLRTAFPALTVWVVDGAYCLMLAGDRTLRMAPGRLAQTLNRADLRPFLGPVGLDSPRAILNCFVTDRAGLAPLLEHESRINTDDRPYNQFFPLSATGFERLRWHIENLRQLVRCRDKTVSILNTKGVDDDPTY